MGIDFENGSSQYITLGNLSENAQNSFCYWFILETINKENPFYTNAIAPGYIIYTSITVGNTPYFQLRQSAAGYAILTGSISLGSGNEYFLALTADGSTMRAYVNGVVDGTTQGYDGTITAGSPSTVIGYKNQGGTAYFDGIMWDARKYNRALSQAEITTMYNSRGSDNIIDGLLGRWNMNEKSEGQIASGANSIIDISSQGIHGTPNNSPVYKGSALKLFKGN